MIYVEGWADKALVQTLTGLPRREIVLGSAKSGVVKRLIENAGVMGMIDEDPGSIQPAYLNQMQIRTLSDLPLLGLRALQDEIRGNRIVLLYPKLEEWIIAAAEEAGLRLDNPRYGLPHNATRLHREINYDLSKLERLVADLSDTPRLLTLRQMLQT